jgi:hypothetical protein
LSYDITKMPYGMLRRTGASSSTDAYEPITTSTTLTYCYSNRQLERHWTSNYFGLRFRSVLRHSFVLFQRFTSFFSFPGPCGEEHHSMAIVIYIIIQYIHVYSSCTLTIHVCYTIINISPTILSLRLGFLR